MANRDAETVTRLRASDGARLAEFPAGSKPFGLAFDGSHLWVANGDTETVTKLKAR